MKGLALLLLVALSACALPRGATVDVDGGAATLGAGVRVDRADAPERDPLVLERDISACGGLHAKGSPEFCGCLRRHGAAGDHEYVAYCEKNPFFEKSLRPAAGAQDARAPAQTFARDPPPAPARAAAVVAAVVRDEGAPPDPYVDAAGRCHQAIGDAHPPPDACDRLVDNLIDADNAARRVVGDEAWQALSETQRRGLLLLSFNVGERGLAGFRDLISAVRGGFGHAAKEAAVDSLWCGQVGEARCQRVAGMLE